jgi:hypothetical protein
MKSKWANQISRISLQIILEHVSFFSIIPDCIW